MIVCAKCNTAKAITEFVVDKGRGCKPHKWCQACEAEYRLSDKRGSFAEANKRYQSTPRGRLKIQQRSRRRRETLALSDNDALLVYERFGHKCFKCQAVSNLAIDHHYPLKHGYALTLSNAVLLCRSCNSRKGTKFPELFYENDELVRLNEIFRDSS